MMPTQLQEIVAASVTAGLAGKRGSMKRKREEVMPQAGRLQSHAAAYISPAPTPHPASAPRRWQHSAVSLQDQSSNVPDPSQLTYSAPVVGLLCTQITTSTLHDRTVFAMPLRDLSGACARTVHHMTSYPVFPSFNNSATNYWLQFKLAWLNSLC